MTQGQQLTDHRIAIEMYVYHLDKTFEEACEELGLDPSEQFALRQSFDQKQCS